MRLARYVSSLLLADWWRCHTLHIYDSQAVLLASFVPIRGQRRVLQGIRSSHTLRVLTSSTRGAEAASKGGWRLPILLTNCRPRGSSRCCVSSPVLSPGLVACRSAARQPLHSVLPEPATVAAAAALPPTFFSKASPANSPSRTSRRAPVKRLHGRESVIIQQRRIFALPPSAIASSSTTLATGHALGSSAQDRSAANRGPTPLPATRPARTLTPR